MSEILQRATAGTMESSDAYVEIEPLVVQDQYLIGQDTDQITDQLLMMFTCSWTGNQKSLNI